MGGKKQDEGKTRQKDIILGEKTSVKRNLRAIIEAKWEV